MKKTLLIIITFLVSLHFFGQTISATIAYQGYDEAEAYLGQGEYQIFLDNTTGILDKPIILLDGIDSGDNRNFEEIYDYLNFEDSNIADQLREDGFDVVVLNFPTYDRASDGIEVNGGADYIQRNAMVLIELITQLNAAKIGDEELVVVGPSMGGLISRYALRYMEQNSLQHETRLFVSWDSPHRGANVPIGFQYLLNYFAESNGGNATFQNAVTALLKNPATKEMLIDHYSSHLDGDYEQDDDLLLPIGAADFRDAFQGELDAMGFPQQTRNICIANGNGNGFLTGTPGMEILNHTFDVSNVANTTIDITLHFTPEASQNIEITKIITNVFGVPILSYDTRSESFPYTDGLDSAPGGMASLAGFGSFSSNSLVEELVENLQQSEYCFIPTLSAMAITNENDWSANIDIPTTHNTPFDAWYIPSENEGHIETTTANVAFVLAEINPESASVTSLDFDSIFKLANNPEQSKITLLSNKKLNSVKLSLFAVTGQELISKDFKNTDNQFSLTVDNLVSGVYFLNAIVDGRTYLKKVLIK